MRDNKFGTIKAASIILLMVIYCLLYALLADNTELFRYQENPENLLCGSTMIYNGLFMVMLYLLESFKVGKRRLMDLFFGFGISSLILNISFYFIIILLLPYAQEPAGELCATLFAEQMVLGATWIMTLHRIFERFHFRKKAILIYGNREDPEEVKRINKTINKYFKISKSIKYTNEAAVIKKAINKATVLYIGDIPAETRNRIVKYCMSANIECFSIPKVSDIYINSANVAQLNDKLLIQYPQIGISGYKAVIKRAGDILISLLMLILASPFMLVIALLVKLEDHGPVFYQQDRVTKDGRDFKMLKFRSMRVSAEEDGPRLASADDDRITRTGRFIRKTHLDELPQLINILKGDMSVVGPRPERHEFIEYYSTKVPEFAERLKVKGGLTGYAQVYGRYNTEPEDKIKYDLYYIYNYSLWLDFKLVLLTLRILFQRENTQGFDEEQAQALNSNTDASEDAGK